MSKIVLITNNSLVVEKYGEKIEVCNLENYSFVETLEFARDKVHAGHKLLTHPLSGSVKPNETPFKSIVIGKNQSSIDFDSLKIIEESIAAAKKFIKGRQTPNWTDKVRNDFRLVDSTIIGSAINSMSGKYVG